MGFKHFDITLTNPPFNRGLDLKIMQVLSGVTDEMVVVHPSTWLIDLKGKSKLFNDTKDMFGDRIKSVTLFNGNPVFGIGLFVPCSITHIDRNKDPEVPIDVDYFSRKFKVGDINDITNFGPEWKTIVEPFMRKIKRYVRKHGSVWDYNITEIVDGKHYCQLAAIRGHVDVTPNGGQSTITQDDFYTIVMEDLNENRGIRKANLVRSSSNTPMPTYEFGSEEERDNFLEYCTTYFARFCLSLYKAGSTLARGELEIVPWLDFTQEWSDEKLFEYFDVDEQTQKYIKGFLPDYYGVYEDDKQQLQAV